MLTQVKIGEDQLLCMLILPYSNFRVIINLTMSVFEGPLIFFWLPPGDRLTIFLDPLVVIVGKNEAVIFQSSSLYNCEIFCVGEGIELHWGSILHGIMVVYL